MSKTYISPNEYPLDTDILALMDEVTYNYKWEDFLGSSTNLSYSFANKDTF